MGFIQKRQQADVRNGAAGRPIRSQPGLSNRSRRCLAREGLVTVDDITTRSERDLTRIPNCGPATIENIKFVLATLGLSLADVPADAPGYIRGELAKPGSKAQS